MDLETKKEFEKVHGSIEKLAISMMQGFEQIDQRFTQVDRRFDVIEADLKQLHQEVHSIRLELERIPDDIDATYSGTLNDLLERVTVIEKRLGIKTT